MDRPWPSGLCLIPIRIRFPSGIEFTGARRANKPNDKDGAIWQPDFSDPLYLKYWGELVAEAGSAMTVTLISTAWTFRRSAIGARAGALYARIPISEGADRHLVRRFSYTRRC